MVRRILRVAIFICAASVGAWDSHGHAAIGMTAMSGVAGSALHQLKRLLSGRDVVDVAGWGPKLVHKYPALDTIFTQPQIQPAENVSCGGFDANVCQNGNCITKAIQYFYAHLAKVPELAPAFTMPVKLKLTDADKMKMLIHLIGDLHQPMRVGYRFNDLGRALKYTYMDRAQNISTTLFNYWETDLGQRLMKDRPNFWYSGWTHVNTLGKLRLLEERQIWEKATSAERLKLFEKWAAESNEIACSKCMRLISPVMGSPPAPDMTRWLADGDVAHPGSVFEHYELLKTQLLTAGLRTSIILNSILQSRHANKFRQGSGVGLAGDIDYVAAAGHVSPPKKPVVSIWKTLGINGLIIAVVLTAFIILTRNFVNPSMNVARQSFKTKDVVKSN